MFGRPFVDQQIAELDVGVAHIGPEKVLPEEVEELAACGVLLEESAVLMPRTGKGAVVHRHVLAQGVEKRRQQVLFIATGGRFQLQPLLCLAVDHRVDASRRVYRLF
ncbi:hypothetical protein D3C75_495310 [compost metagenome]